MPVAVVALAAGSFAAGATAFAAATTLAASIAAGAVMVGSALTIVGTVTGNQRLAKIGGLIGLAGGIGGAMSSASAGSDALASTGGQMSDAGGTVASDAANSAGTSAATDAATSNAATTADSAAQTGAVDVATAPVQTPLSDTGMIGSASAGGDAALPAVAGASDGDVIQQGMIDAAQNQAATYNAGQTAVGQSASDVSKLADANAFAPGATDGDIIQQGMLDAAKAGGTITDPGLLSQLQTWVKQNPTLAKIAGETAKGALGSLVVSPKDQAMMDLQRQQADLLRRRAAYGAGKTTY